MSADELGPMEGRILRGIDALGRSAAEWLTAADLDARRGRAAVGRAIGGGLAGFFAGGVVYELGPIAWSASAVLAAAAVWSAGRGEDEPPGDEGFGPTEFLELLHDLSGGRNVHLSAVREQLAAETGRPWSGPEVRALCAAAGVPVRDGVRVPGALPAVTTGIHRDDLPPLPHPSSGGPVGGVGAGQQANNNTNNGPTVEEVGQGARIIKTGPSIRQEVTS